MQGGKEEIVAGATIRDVLFSVPKSKLHRFSFVHMFDILFCHDSVVVYLGRNKCPAGDKHSLFRC